MASLSGNPFDEFSYFGNCKRLPTCKFWRFPLTASFGCLQKEKRFLFFTFQKRKTTENWDENTKYKQIYDLVSKPTKLPFTLLLLQKFQIFEQRWIEETKPKLQVFKQKEEQVLLQRILRNSSSFFPSSIIIWRQEIRSQKESQEPTNLIGQCSGLSRNGSL